MTHTGLVVDDLTSMVERVMQSSGSVGDKGIVPADAESVLLPDSILRGYEQFYDVYESYLKSFSAAVDKVFPDIPLAEVEDECPECGQLSENHERGGRCPVDYAPQYAQGHR